MNERISDVRFTPRSRHAHRRHQCLLSATRGSQRASQGVLIDPAVLHDDDEVLARVFQQLDVGNRIAVNQQQVGERMFRRIP
jgi:hypothetical protein